MPFPKTSSESGLSLLVFFAWLAVSLSLLIVTDWPHRFEWPPGGHSLNALHALPVLLGWFAWRLHRILQAGNKADPSTFRTLSFAFCASLYLLACAYAFRFEIDDSYITMQYARNLVDGYGLAFSPGDRPIEGYTNFSLVLIEAALISVGLTELWPVKLLLIASGLALLWFMHAYLWRRAEAGGSYEAPFLATLLTATSTPIVLWTVGGLETILFTAAVAIAYVLYAWARLEPDAGRNKWAAGDLLLAFAVLTRPEGALFFGLGMLYRWWQFARTRRQARNVQIKFTLVAVGIVLAYAAWKLSYFGDLRPATYLAKVRDFSWLKPFLGVERFAHFLTVNHHGIMLAGILTLAGVIARGLPKRPSPALLLATSLLSFSAYLWSLGYEVSMDLAYRLYVPLIPLGALLLADRWLTAGIRFTYRQRMTLIILATAFLLIGRVNDLTHAWNVSYDWHAKNYGSSARNVFDGLQRGHVTAGKWLRERVPEGETIVLHDAGAIPYYSGLKVIDTWSLGDPAIIGWKRAMRAATSSVEYHAAREKIQQYVLEHNPLLIVQDREGLIEAAGDRYKPLGVTFAAGYDITPWIRSECESNLYFTADALDIGKRQVTRDMVWATPGDRPGNLFKLDFTLAPAQYEAAFRYTARRGKDKRIGVWQIFDAEGNALIERRWLQPTGNKTDVLRAELTVAPNTPQPLNTRLWYIDGTVGVDSFQIKPPNPCLKYY